MLHPPPHCFSNLSLHMCHLDNLNDCNRLAVSQHSIALPLDFPIDFTQVKIYINNLNWSVLSPCFLSGLATLP